MHYCIDDFQKIASIKYEINKEEEIINLTSEKLIVPITWPYFFDFSCGFQACQESIKKMKIVSPDIYFNVRAHLMIYFAVLSFTGHNIYNQAALH